MIARRDVDGMEEAAQLANNWTNNSSVGLAGRMRKILLI